MSAKVNNKLQYRITIIGSILVLSLLFYSCASSVRYTSKHKSDTETNSKNEIYDLEEIYGSSNSLETNIEIASYYSDEFNGRKTANGEIYDMYGFTAAHVSYPFNSVVRVTNLSNNKKVILRISDRKPDTNGRAIDLSLKAAQVLGMISTGIAKVKVEVLEWGNKQTH